ncbi:protein of unknown function [Nitrospina watsonii]|uniref:Uncharacterized protein n=1 Tax=Nitrospina watsonii TaxID=1323948 RepID=A0ABN8W4A6_9BACT|nr:protein of unknown function [Nitrospina watsonii]
MNGGLIEEERVTVTLTAPDGSVKERFTIIKRKLLNAQDRFGRTVTMNSIQKEEPHCPPSPQPVTLECSH